MKKDRLAIFDLDGTLFDTAPANFAAYQHALHNHGFSLDEETFFKRCNGRYYKDFLPPIIGRDEQLLEIIHKEKTASYPQYFHRMRENRALFDLLDTLRPVYHTALVTTASKPSVMAILDCFNKRDKFDLILTQQDVVHKKPAPDGFLMAMQHFDIPAEKTIIFEDSDEGIAAARACGAAYFLVQEIL